MAKKAVLAFYLGILTILTGTLASGLEISPENIINKASINRFPDPVIIQAKTFPDLTQGALENYRVYACHGGKFEPIRFQIDEMTEEGDFIFTYGKLSNKELSNGLLDPRDLVLFMAHDAGDKITEESWPKGILKGQEIEVIDPIDQTRAWAYLFLFERNPPPRCPLPDYITYDYDTETLGGEYWKVKYIIDEKGKHTNIYDTFHVLPAAGGTGENFIDRLKIRAKIGLFFGKITLTTNEEKFDSYVVNTWIQGPIRVVRRLEHIVRGPFKMTLVRILSDVYYYETMFTCPIHFNFPFKIERVLTSLTLRIGTDYSPAVKGSIFYNDNNLQGILINGRMDETEANFNNAADHWRVMTGKWGSLMTRSVLTPEAEKQLAIVQGVTDDETFMNPPERFPGNIGWTWSDWRIGRLPGGHYTFYLEFYAPPHYKPGDEIVYLNYLDHPIRVKIGDKIKDNQARLFGVPGKGF